MDWTGCSEVEQITGKVSGAPILKNSRLHAAGVLDNYNSGMTPAQIADMLTVPLPQVKAVLAFAFPEKEFEPTTIDWTGCSEVERLPNKFAGMVPVLKDLRTQPDAILEAFNNGMTLEELSEWFDESPKERIQAVLDFAFLASRKAK